MSFNPNINNAWSIPFDIMDNVNKQADNIKWGSNGQFYYRNSQGGIFNGNQYIGVKGIKSPVIRFLARCNYPIQIAIGSYNTWKGYEVDSHMVGYNTVYQGATTISGIAGGWAGGKAGMWAGGVFGAYFGGIGVIPGAIIGGVMGGVLGSWSISSVTEYGVNKYYQR